jgi:hypothetical protein
MLYNTNKVDEPTRKCKIMPLEYHTYPKNLVEKTAFMANIIAYWN